MAFLVPSSSFFSFSSCLSLSAHSTWVYLVIKISNNASLAISLFSLNKRSYAMSGVWVVLLRFPPGAQFCWFLFFAVLISVRFVSPHLKRSNIAKLFFVVKMFSVRETFPMSFSMASCHSLAGKREKQQNSNCIQENCQHKK